MDAGLESKILSQGMNPEVVQQQISHFENGFPFLQIVAPATPENGIKVLSEKELSHFKNTYPEKASQIEVVKFVPASGAASRMFKDLFAFLEGDGDISKSAFVQKFMNNIEKFAFYDDLNEALQSQGSSINQKLDSKDYKGILAALLDADGLAYGSLPKGLLRFHTYPDERRTPAHEHLIEGVQYATGAGNTVKIHFTVSPEHESKFKAEIASILPKLEKEYGINFDISYSQQKSLRIPLLSIWTIRRLWKRMVVFCLDLQDMGLCWKT